MNDEANEYQSLEHGKLIDCYLSLNDLKKIADTEFLKFWCSGELQKVKAELKRRKKKRIIRGEYELQSFSDEQLLKLRLELLSKYIQTDTQREKNQIGYKSKVVNEELFNRTQNPIYKTRNPFKN